MSEAFDPDHPVKAFWESWVHDVVAAAASWLPESTDLEAVVAAAEAVAVTRPSDPDRFLVEREWLRAAVPSTTLDSPSADLAVPIVVASDDDGCADMPGLVALPARPDAAPREALTEGTPHPQTGRDHIVVTQMPTPSPARPMHACAVDNVFSEEGRPTVPSATAIERFTANLLQGLETELVPPTLQIAITVIMIEELAGLFVFLLNRLPPRGAVSAADFRHFRDETHAVLGAAVLPRMRAHLGPSLADIVQIRALREAALCFFVAAHDAQHVGPVFRFHRPTAADGLEATSPADSTPTAPAVAPHHSSVRTGVPSSGPGSSTSTPDSVFRAAARCRTDAPLWRPNADARHGRPCPERPAGARSVRHGCFIPGSRACVGRSTYSSPGRASRFDRVSVSGTNFGICGSCDHRWRFRGFKSSVVLATQLWVGFSGSSRCPSAVANLRSVGGFSDGV